MPHSKKFNKLFTGKIADALEEFLQMPKMIRKFNYTLQPPVHEQNSHVKNISYIPVLHRINGKNTNKLKKLYAINTSYVPKILGESKHIIILLSLYNRGTFFLAS